MNKHPYPTIDNQYVYSLTHHQFAQLIYALTCNTSLDYPQTNDKPVKVSPPADLLVMIRMVVHVRTCENTLRRMQIQHTIVPLRESSCIIKRLRALAELQMQNPYISSDSKLLGLLLKSNSK